MRTSYIPLIVLAMAGGLFAGELLGPGLDDYDRELGQVGAGTLASPIDYEFFRPPGHEQADLPLVVFMHGLTDGLPSKQGRLNETIHDLVHATQKENGDRGVDCVDVTGAAEPSCSYFDDQFASFLLVPKSIEGAGWSEPDRNEIDALVADLLERYGVDGERIYLTGFSDGGFSILRSIAGSPERFAAAVSLSAGSTERSRRVIRDLSNESFWFFHGDNDPIVNSEMSSGLHDALLEGGVQSRLTLVPGGGHNAGYEVAFRDAENEFYPWMFAQVNLDPTGDCLETAGTRLTGDVNNDSTVTFADFLTLAANYSRFDVGFDGGDIDCNGRVSMSDFLLLSSNFGASEESVAAVPEPASYVLAWLLVLAIGFRRRVRGRRMI